MKFVKPLQVQAYETLKAMILNGEFEPKTIYSETKSSQALRISRTPLRDAIQRLTQEGYLDVIPSKGFCIHEMTEKDLIETYQIRCALEGFCAVQLARDHALPAAQRVFRQLDALLREQEEIVRSSRSIEEFAQYDQEFHKNIVHYLKNSVISDTFDNYHYQMSRQTILSLHQEGRTRETIEEHRAILESIKKGDVSATYAATLTHLEKPKGLIHLEENS